MKLLRFLVRTCRGMVAFTGATALASGACNAGLIAVVNMTLNHSRFQLRFLAAGFLALTIGKVATNYISQVFLVRYAQGAASELRRDLIRKILLVPLRQLEVIGIPSILVALTDDVANVTQALLAFPIITVNVAILLCGAVYLAWLSWQILLGSMLLIVVGAVSYRLLMHSAFHWLSQARAEEDKLFSHFRSLTEGIKELKLHRERRAAFFTQHVQPTTEIFARHNIAAERRFIIAQNWSHILFYILVGLILFLLPSVKPISLPTLTGYILTIMYLMGPLAGVMSSFSLFGRAEVALRRVEQLGISLASGPREEEVPSHSTLLVLRGEGVQKPDGNSSHFTLPRPTRWGESRGEGATNEASRIEPVNQPGTGDAQRAFSLSPLAGPKLPSDGGTERERAGRESIRSSEVHGAGTTSQFTARPTMHPFESLELHRVVHSYHREKEDANFVLGPISLHLDAGELVFLVGGNGSGKSTLAKIIAGLYFPEAGEIRLNGQVIDNHNRDDYRQLFSAVFSDFYLFESLLGLSNPDLDTQAREYLARLHLNQKVAIRDGVLSTTSLSQGQRKRLALLTAYLEDRPIYLFDEWASDQDPHFKDVFYTQLLPELKARGKTVLVISHDDKYFHLADRLLKLDYGKLESAPSSNGELAHPLPA